MLAPPELKAIHPLGKSPVLENTETKEVIAKSGAIVEVEYPSSDFPRHCFLNLQRLTFHFEAWFLGMFVH